MDSDSTPKGILEYVSNELHSINKELQEIKLDTRENTFSLKEHMRRTEALEKFVETIHVRFDESEKSRLSTEAVHKYRRERFDFWAKVLAMLAAISTIVFGYLKLKGMM